MCCYISLIKYNTLLNHNGLFYIVINNSKKEYCYLYANEFNITLIIILNYLDIAQIIKVIKNSNYYLTYW